jgi:uncharacterized membrane-anchored protein
MKAPFATLTRVCGLILSLAARRVSAQGPAAAPASPGQVTGPAVVELPGRSSFDLPAGCVFLNEATTKVLLGRLGAPLAGGEVGAVIPPGKDWLAIIKILDSAYVSDREWGRLDAAAILARLRKIDQEANQRRQVAGGSAVTSLEWEQKPVYDSKAHRLDWAVKAGLSSGEVVNRVSALLGRGSVVEFFLVDQTRSSAAVKAFGSLAGSLTFHGGFRYEDHLTGDKSAAGGLETLLAGPSGNSTPAQEARAGSGPNAPVERRPASAPVEGAHAASGPRLPVAQRSIPIWAWVYLVMGACALSGATAWLVLRINSSYRRRKQRGKASFDANRYFHDLTRDLYRGGR